MTLLKSQPAFPWITVALMLLSANSAHAQLQAVQRAGVSQFGGSGFGYDQGWTYTIFNKTWQKELEIVDEQAEDLKKIRDEFYKAQQKLYKEHSGAGQADPLARAELRERVADLREKMTKQLNETLLPHQVQRAKQLWLQNQLRYGAANGLRDARLRELLDISDEQYEKIQKRSLELNTELAKKYRELRAEAAQDLLKELTPAQRKKLEDLSGEKREAK